MEFPNFGILLFSSLLISNKISPAGTGVPTFSELELSRVTGKGKEIGETSGTEANFRVNLNTRNFRGEKDVSVKTVGSFRQGSTKGRVPTSLLCTCMVLKRALFFYFFFKIIIFGSSFRKSRLKIFCTGMIFLWGAIRAEIYFDFENYLKNYWWG